jgi:ribosomal protein S6E (S10)
MADFQVVVGDADGGNTCSFGVEGQDANRFVGRCSGETVDGGAVGLPGYTLAITGGSDDTGRPMRDDVRGSELKNVLLAGGTGFVPTPGRLPSLSRRPFFTFEPILRDFSMWLFPWRSCGSREQ